MAKEKLKEASDRIKTDLAEVLDLPSTRLDPQQISHPECIACDAIDDLVRNLNVKWRGRGWGAQLVKS